MRTTLPQPNKPVAPSMSVVRTVWAALAASLAIPWGLSRLSLPHPVTPPLAPETLTNLVYGLGITLAAAALLLYQRWPAQRGQAILFSAILAEGIAWLGFAAWLMDKETPALSPLLFMAAVTFWLIRPRTRP